MKRSLSKINVVGLDTNIFIYHFHNNPDFTSYTDKIFNLLVENKIKVVTSLITLIELLSFKAPHDRLRRLKESFEQLPNLTVFPVDESMALKIAEIRREYGFRLPDSIQLATALLGKAQVFISNDQKLKKFQEVKIIPLGKI